jgi:hypothetical protein
MTKKQIQQFRKTEQFKRLTESQRITLYRLTCALYQLEPKNAFAEGDNSWSPFANEASKAR